MSELEEAEKLLLPIDERQVCDACKGSDKNLNGSITFCARCAGRGWIPSEKASQEISNMLRKLPNEEVKTEYEYVDHPPHYGGDTTYETIKVLRAWGLTDNFCLGNCVKYLSRCGRKPGESILKDLKKVAWYLQDEIEFIESQGKK